METRPATGQAPKALVPLTIAGHVLAERRGAWKAKKGDGISMSVGSVTFRLGTSPVTFPGEVIISFSNENDTDPTAYVRQPSGKFQAPLFAFDGANAKAANAELNALMDRAASEWLEWFAQQKDQPAIDDPTVALSFIGGAGKRGVKIKKAAK